MKTRRQGRRAKSTSRGATGDPEEKGRGPANIEASEQNGGEGGWVIAKGKAKAQCVAIHPERAQGEAVVTTKWKPVPG